MSEFSFTYDAATRTGIIKLAKSGEELRISNISAEQATRWKEEKAAEFAKRGFRMQTVPTSLTRGETDV
jgi:hypothetical protein